MRGTRAQAAGALTVAGYDPGPVLDEAARFPGAWAYTPDRHRAVVLDMRGGTWEVADTAAAEDRLASLRHRGGCTECEGPEEHLPEECPSAAWYTSGATGGACEAWFVTRGEGRGLAAEHGWGTEAYYEAVIAGVDLAHQTGECPL